MPTRSSPMLQSYSEFLASSFGNFTQTYFADHSELWSHDQINRQLRSQKWTPRSLRQYLRNQIQFSHQGYLLFDDTVLDKRHSHFIEMVRRQWSGNAHAVIPGIGVVTCVYVNPELQRFWVLDFRLFDPERDGRSKIDHLLEMFDRVLQSCASSIRVVLMDSWYASMKVIKAIEKAHKVYYCPLKRNRQATQGPEMPYQRLDTLPFDESEEQSGKLVHLKKFPKGHQVKLFRLVSSTGDTEWIVTNDLSEASASAVRKQTAVRWKIEQFHRQWKQTTGVQRCQCRKQRAQRNHITASLLAWAHLHQAAMRAKTTVYALKQGLLDDYLCKQLRKPAFAITSA